MTDTERLARQRLAQARAEGCAGCIYYVSTQWKDGTIDGECRVRSHIPNTIADIDFWWPQRSPDDWCGEWFPREADQPDKEASDG